MSATGASEPAFTDVYAVPGERSIIDAIHPATDRGLYSNETLDEIRTRYPAAVRMTWHDWSTQRAKEQQTPLVWDVITRERYREWLEVLPPAAWENGAYLVGEPSDHCYETGKPRFQMCRACGPTDARVYQASSRPVTVAEFRALVRSTS